MNTERDHIIDNLTNRVRAVNLPVTIHGIEDTQEALTALDQLIQDRIVTKEYQRLSSTLVLPLYRYNIFGHVTHQRQRT
jgi:hypothetical protein